VGVGWHGMVSFISAVTAKEIKNNFELTKLWVGVKFISLSFTW
jgi:hypothetical protein